jgi:hypothetical protein
LPDGTLSAGQLTVIGAVIGTLLGGVIILLALPSPRHARSHNIDQPAPSVAPPGWVERAIPSTDLDMQFGNTQIKIPASFGPQRSISASEARKFPLLFGIAPVASFLINIPQFFPLVGPKAFFDTHGICNDRGMNYCTEVTLTGARPFGEGAAYYQPFLAGKTVDSRLPVPQGLAGFETKTIDPTVGPQEFLMLYGCTPGPSSGRTILRFVPPDWIRFVCAP